MITQNNNPNPSRKGFQKNEFLKGRGVYCCLVNVPDDSWIRRIGKGRGKMQVGTNLFFSSSEKEIYDFYRFFDEKEFYSSAVYAAVYAPNSECETENT